MLSILATCFASRRFNFIGMTTLASPLLLCIALTLALSPAAHGAKFYRWVDENGQVYYSDKVPQEHIKQKREELDDRGIVIRTIDAAKTPEQLAEEQRQAKLREAQAQQRREAELHDQWLLSTYRSEHDLIRARDDKIATIESSAKLTRERVDGLKKDLEKMRSAAANHERAGKAVPEELRSDITKVERQIAEHLDFYLKKKQEQTQIGVAYDRDLARLNELLARKKQEKSGAVIGR